MVSKGPLVDSSRAMIWKMDKNLMRKHRVSTVLFPHTLLGYKQVSFSLFAVPVKLFSSGCLTAKLRIFKCVETHIQGLKHTYTSLVFTQCRSLTSLHSTYTFSSYFYLFIISQIKVCCWTAANSTLKGLTSLREAEFYLKPPRQGLTQRKMMGF